MVLNHEVLYPQVKLEGISVSQKENRSFSFLPHCQSNAITPGACTGLGEGLVGAHTGRIFLFQKLELLLKIKYSFSILLRRLPSEPPHFSFLQILSSLFKPLWLRDPRGYENSFNALSYCWRVNTPTADQ